MFRCFYVTATYTILNYCLFHMFYFCFFLFNLSSCFRIMLSLNSRYNVLVEVYVQWLDVFLCGVVPQLCRCISLWRCPSTLPMFFSVALSLDSACCMCVFMVSSYNPTWRTITSSTVCTSRETHIPYITT